MPRSARDFPIPIDCKIATKGTMTIPDPKTLNISIKPRVSPSIVWILVSGSRGVGNVTALIDVGVMQSRFGSSGAIKLLAFVAFIGTISS